ncbi:hypothetical protein [Amycolatopsis azurea]|uniref:YbaB/EbfC DNA-binding family protein n=1 Tax=Amycolatopsis azurea DSM 43854 TaxID=1238180 RepID=M2PFT5_9PSEU|nr:hypothetical protein [Amycolatopsis azurea]EMD23233.1 hypothetical protein C791_7473 [Amycolatopsis azurea DSM 43854]OOC06120.1 hypothetical protein B0293_13765 [Amycolatopsis azurea DSM 43854]
MSYENELYHLAKEIDASAAAVEQAAAGAARDRVTWTLPGELGSVTVTGAGELVDVSVDVAAMKDYSASSLSRQLLLGIQRAEEAAVRRYDAAIAAVQNEERLV